MSVLGHLLLSGEDGYTISRSVRLRSSASAYFNRTLTTPTNNKIWTWSSWVKRGTLGAAQILLSSDVGTSNSTWLEFGFDAADTFTITSYATDSNTTSAVFRDPSAWYHIIVAFDSTQATAANRCKIYVNGVQQTLTGSGFTLNAGYGINSAQAHSIGQRNWASGVGRYFDGYLTEINFIDGQALTPTSFGQFNSVTGVWQPIKYTGTYGTNGFYLNFSDNSNNTATTIGKDYSGNGNNWTPNNISVTSGSTYDSMLDVPTPYADGGNGRGNYCVLNPLDKGTATVSDGNLGMNRASGGYSAVRASIAIPTTGKWYWEATLVTSGGSGNDNIGVALSTMSNSTYVGDTGSYSYQSNGLKYTSGTSSSYGASFTSSDLIGVAFDADAGTVTFYKNNSSQGTAFTGLTSGPYFPAVSAWGSTWALNFGQRPFTYTPPSGYVALNTFNLPAPTISNGATVMAASTYTGTGATQTIANSGNNAASISFKPDWVWIKSRSAATNNNLFDSVRGTTNYLISNSSAAEATNANTLTAFGTTGFTLGSDASALGVNVNAATYVAWQWQAGQGTTSSNTSGSITSTVSVNATAGFSVVTYTGIAGNVAKTFGHGLGVAPSMVIIKPRTTASAFNAWVVWHSAFTGSEYIYLDLTNAKATSANYWGATVPSSTVVTVGGNSSNVSNESGINYVAYCFSAVPGYSAFGSYTGNGSSDGPFVYLGFRPRWVMTKRTDSTGSWLVVDSSRNSYNVVNGYLVPNTSDAEGSATWGDFTSNGFKLRGTTHNGSGESYIYAAFAENPYKLALAR